jgi:hypothetical protein
LLWSSTSDPSPPAQSVSIAQTNTPYPVPTEPILDQKVFTGPHSWQSSTTTNKEATAYKADIILPLQPPPRKRWTASGLPPLNTNVGNHAFGHSGRPNSLQVPRLSMDESELQASQIDALSSLEHRPWASSLHSPGPLSRGSSPSVYPQLARVRAGSTAATTTSFAPNPSTVSSLSAF